MVIQVDVHVIAFGDDREHVVYMDAWRGLVFLASVNAYHSNQQLGDISLLKVAKESFDEIFLGNQQLTVSSITHSSHLNDGFVDCVATDVEELLRQYGLLTVAEYRSAGIIYGQWSKQMDIEKKLDEALLAERLMLNCWDYYITHGPPHETKELAHFVRDLQNPYRGAAIRKTAIPPWWDRRHERYEARTPYINDGDDTTVPHDPNIIDVAGRKIVRPAFEGFVDPEDPESTT
jgi:hypothetical protein